MENYKELCLALYERYLRDHLRDTFDPDAATNRSKEFFNDQLLAQLKPYHDDISHTKEINAFVIKELMLIGQNVLEENMVLVVDTILKDISEWVFEVLDESEAKKIYEFFSSDLGCKLLRNMDLFKKSYSLGVTILSRAMLCNILESDLVERITNFMDTLLDGDVENE